MYCIPKKIIYSKSLWSLPKFKKSLHSHTLHSKTKTKIFIFITLSQATFILSMKKLLMNLSFTRWWKISTNSLPPSSISLFHQYPKALNQHRSKRKTFDQQTKLTKKINRILNAIKNTTEQSQSCSTVLSPNVAHWDSLKSITIL